MLHSVKPIIGKIIRNISYLLVMILNIVMVCTFSKSHGNIKKQNPALAEDIKIHVTSSAEKVL